MKNQILKKSWINPKIEIKNTKYNGKGMPAKEPIKKDETILILGGEYTNKKNAMLAKANGKLVLQLDDNLWSIEERGKDQAYFINHSCDSNTWMKDAHTLIAKNNIKTGEQITADYTLWEADENYISKWECKCGSSKCRKIITGKDWRLSEIQERYKNHFSPLINKRIKKLNKNEN